MYRRETLQSYVADAAARKSAPGGGSVCALVGALAAAMSEMCGNFTIGKEKFAAHERTVEDMLDELSKARTRLLELVDEDVTAYRAVSRALKRHAETEVQRASRRQDIDAAFRAALNPPRKVVQLCARIGSIAEKMADVGNPNLISDVGVSAVLAEGAAASARLNILVNTKYLKDRALTKTLLAEVDGLCRDVANSRDKVVRKVTSMLRK